MLEKINVAYGGEKYIGYEAEDMPLPALLVALCQRLNELVSERRQLTIKEAFGWVDAYAVEAAAVAFISDKYQSEPPILIQAWADERNMSSHDAADNVVDRAKRVRLRLTELSEILRVGHAGIEKASSHSEALSALQAAINKAFI